jgi:hypothetical protein
MKLAMLTSDTAPSLHALPQLVCFPFHAAHLGSAVGRPSSSRAPLRCALLPITACLSSSAVGIYVSMLLAIEATLEFAG